MRRLSMILSGVVLVLGIANFIWGFSPVSLVAAAYIVMAASALEEERKIPFGDVGLAVLGVWVSLFLLFSLSKGLSG